MKRVERRATIGAPPPVVFAYLSDLDRLAEWQTGVVSTRRTSEGPIAVGATVLVTREVMGTRVEAPLTVTEYDPPRRLAISSEVSGVKARAALDLAIGDRADTTQLVFAMEIRGSLLTAFMEPMIASAAGGEIDASLARIRARFDPG